MMQEVAKVISWRSGWAVVEVEMKSACNHCDTQDSCGTSAVAKAFSAKKQTFSVPCEKECQPNDLLQLGLPESVILKAAALVYILPLVGLFIGALLAQFFVGLVGLESELFIIGFAVIGAVLAWWLAKRQAKHLEESSAPVVLRNLGQEISQELVREIS